MKNTAGRAAIIALTITIASLTLTACGSENTDCPKPAAAASSTLTVNAAAYIPARASGGHASEGESHTAPIIGSHGSSTECSK